MSTILRSLLLKNHKTLNNTLGVTFKSLRQSFQNFIWEKYKREHHLPSYNYLGPNTCLDIQLDENNQPKPGEEPINAIDQLAYIHDLAYQISDNISDRHQADIHMISGLKQLKNLSIHRKLIRAMIIKIFQAKLKLGVGLSIAAKTQAIENIFKEPKKVIEKNTKQLTNELGERQQFAEELHKQYKKPKQLRKIYFHSKDNIWNADLVIMPTENNYKYILTIVVIGQLNSPPLVGNLTIRCKYKKKLLSPFIQYSTKISS